MSTGRQVRVSDHTVQHASGTRPSAINANPTRLARIGRMILLITAKVIPRYPVKAERPRCIWRGLSRAPEDARTSRHTTGLASFTVNERITERTSHHLDR